MVGIFTLELDTTSPEVSIYAPNYTTNSSSVEIVVVANEVLFDGYQNFYIVDQYGDRHNYTFTYNESQFIGEIVLSDFDNGLVTFYAQVKDSVYNISSLISKTIQIIPSVNYLRLNIDDSITVGKITPSEVIGDISVSIEESTNYSEYMTIEERENTLSDASRETTTESQSDCIEINTEVVTE